jgi:hypothetical protein
MTEARAAVLAQLDACFSWVKLIGIAARASRMHGHQV